jgi:hypothetical protein
MSWINDSLDSFLHHLKSIKLSKDNYEIDIRYFRSPDSVAVEFVVTDEYGVRKKFQIPSYFYRDRAYEEIIKEIMNLKKPTPLERLL